MISLENYDLKNEQDVFKLGHELGKQLSCDVLNPLSCAMGPELSVIFYAALLAAPAGSMYAALDQDGADAVMNEITRISGQVADAHTKNRH
ncbi:hypothetical protein SAMN05216428_102325 [Nitrosospira sp. Nsp11]|uniref:hypothetical protein n=1 Tax=Nitrosospira sp. Nsp11 TaxID=1855338 RepID=UPI0009137CC2|nr:hypothetical protein [Nitrosospira sp. Nsp11]SHL41358.1 hypothetical protein SAMN05216428_102325 [Nitrosospira sp. Nsp11]